MSMRFITPASLNSISNSIQIDRELCKIVDAEVFAFLHSCDLESRLRSIRIVPKCTVQ